MNMLKEFGKDFIKQSRDRTLEKYEAIKSGTMKSEKATRLHALLKELGASDLQALDAIVMEMIDATIFNTLFLFEESADWAIVRKDSAIKNEIANIADASDGLAGELFGEDGWIAQYSHF